MEKFVSARITSLRKQKGVSEYRMSFDLGRSRGYINNISTGKTMPSMAEFFAICEYLETTPHDFFNTQLEQPQLLQKICNSIERLSTKDQMLVLDTIQRLEQPESLRKLSNSFEKLSAKDQELVLDMIQLLENNE